MEICRRHVPEAGTEAMGKHYAAMHAGIDIWRVRITSVTGKARNKQGYFNRIKSA